MNFKDFHQKYVVEKTGRSTARKELRELLKSCFDAHPDVVKICLIGWTPGFNDGEACTHSEDVVILTKEAIFDSSGQLSDDFGWHLKRGDKTEEELREMLTLGYDWGQSTFEIPDSVDMMSLVTDYSPGKKHCPHLKDLYDLLRYQPLAHLAYDTNYALVVTVEGNNVGVDHREFNIGH